MPAIGTISNEDYDCVIRQDTSGRVHFTADGDIDADGANGQGGSRPAYKADNTGSEALANGGMGRRNGRVVCLHHWARDIVILGPDNEPRIFPGGIIASMTWYRYPGRAINDPLAYVNSETIPYLVVPPLIIQRTAGVVRGCKGRITYHGRSVDCVVADKGPASKIGELSIAAARAVGIPPSPRTGGRETADILYELWPGVAAPGFVLQPA
jgi:hypothetical protein